MTANLTQTLVGGLSLMVKSFKAEAAILKYRAVQLGTNDDTVLASTDGAASIGVSLNAAPNVGDTVRVGMLGIFPVQANAGIAKNAVVNAAAAAGLIDDGCSAGEIGLGIALRAAAAQNDIIPVFVCPIRVHA